MKTEGEIPKQLLNSLAGLESFNEKAFVEAHGDEHKITSIRFNPFKKAVPDFELGEKVLWADDAWYLASRPSFTHDPLFHAGCYYVQEAGSMFIEFALKNTVDLTQSLNVLDLCGAPGGKSTLINSLINDESLLVANELIKSRAGILAHNLGKWGTRNTVVTNSEAAKFGALTGFFDVLVIDAPCSGSGLFRKQPEAIAEWSEDNVNLCSTRQRKILEDTLPCLKENGLLIYSTCSYSEKE
ncbi:MAG: RsmB/NOP family class I SAM-dependent RNA methyltransferase, partial [Bacteroidota bacterium]